MMKFDLKMFEEEKQDEVSQVEDKVNDTLYAKLDEEDKRSIIDTIKGFFVKDDEDKTEVIEETNAIDEVDKKEIQLTQEELEELIKQKTQENVNALAKKTKEKEKAKIEVNKKLETIDPKFHDFVKFNMQSEDFDFDNFKNENPHMVIKKSTVSGITTNIKPASVETPGAQHLKRNGLI